MEGPTSRQLDSWSGGPEAQKFYREFGRLVDSSHESWTGSPLVSPALVVTDESSLQIVDWTTSREDDL